MDEFKGKLGNYKIIQTDDQTKTVWSEFFNETCHHLSGAKEETVHNYILGCHLLKIFNEVGITRPIHILDVGFGVAMGLTCLIEFIEAQQFSTHIIHYTSIELDDVLALWSLQTFHPQIAILKITENELTYLSGSYKNIQIKILLGDGRLTLPVAIKNNVIGNFHAIFQDAFSPNKNQTLWTVEWFHFLKKESYHNVALSTYSASVSIRKSLVVAGWIIENHKGYSLKRSMTTASLTGVIDDLLLDQLAKSPTIELYDI